MSVGSKGPPATLQKVMPPSVAGPRSGLAVKSPPGGSAPAMSHRPSSLRPTKTVVGGKMQHFSSTQPSSSTPRPKMSAHHRPGGSTKIPPQPGFDKPVSAVSPNAHPTGTIKRPPPLSPIAINATAPSAVSVGSSRIPSGSTKQYFPDPGAQQVTVENRPTAWYPTDADHIEPHVSPHGVSARKTVYRVEDPKQKDAPPEFLAQQWQGQQGSGNFGWWQGASVQDDVVVGTLLVQSMDLAMLPPNKYKQFEEKAALDIARLFSHPPWHVTVSAEPGSVVLRYRLELPEPGPNAGAVLSRAAAEFGKRSVRLPDLEREYRMLTGTDVPAIIQYEKSEPPSAAKRAKAMSPEADTVMQFQSHHQPLEVMDVEGARHMEMIGPHKKFDGSKEWAQLPARPPPLPGCVAASVPLQTEITLPRVPGDSFAHGQLQMQMQAAAPPRLPSRDTASERPSPSPSQYGSSHGGGGGGGVVGFSDKRSLSPPANRNSVTHMLGEQRSSGLAQQEIMEVRRNLDPFLKEMEAKYADAGRQGNAVLQAQILGELGAKFHDAGDYERSVVYLTRQVELLQNIEHPDRLNDMSKACSMLGNAYWSMGMWERALSYHQKRLEIAEMQKDRRGMGAAYGNLGNVYHAMGDYRAATQYHMRHHNCVEGDDMDTMGAVYHNLGLAQYGANDIDSALDSFRHALEITVALGNQKQVWRTCSYFTFQRLSRGLLASCNLFFFCLTHHITGGTSAWQPCNGLQSKGEAAGGGERAAPADEDRAAHQ